MLARILQPPGKNWQALLCFGAATFLLYFPVLGNGFLTDDYAALYRICVEKTVLHSSFFRPLIDISFYCNYLVSGLHPWSYYVFNMVVHALTCYMTYRVAKDLQFFDEERQAAYAWVAGWLFLFYPFHNEPVVWLAGRLSSMAALCALVAIYFSLQGPGSWKNLLLAGAFMLAGLLAYESIIMLPAIVLALTWRKEWSKGKLVRIAGFWAGVVGLYLLARYFIGGALMMEYKKDQVVSHNLPADVVRLVKSAGRSLLPPIEQAGIMIAAAVVVYAGVAYLHYMLWLRRKSQRVFFTQYVRVAVAFLLSMSLLALIGVSTRTSEGDRLLYFPSAFLCIMASACIFLLVKKRRRFFLLTGLLIAIGIFFTERDVRQWIRASRASDDVLTAIRSGKNGNVVLINMPDETEGAPVFRNNFDKFLVMNGVDSNRVYVNNFILRLEYLTVKGNIQPEEKDSGVFIAPWTMIRPDGTKLLIENLQTGTRRTFTPGDDPVYYWDKSQLKSLTLKTGAALHL